MINKSAFSLLVAAGMFVGCFKSSGADAAPKAAAPAAPAAGAAKAAAPAASAARVVTINVGVKDETRFDVTTFDAKPGEEIKIVLTNKGTLPKAAMGHNLVLLKAGTDAQSYSLTAAGAGATDYIPADLNGSVIAHTKLLGPGESDSVTFKAPTAPGEYVFLCSFSAHYLLGMKGTMVVK